MKRGAVHYLVIFMKNPQHSNTPTLHYSRFKATIPEKVVIE
jgi:hypothetical protein